MQPGQGQRRSKLEQTLEGLLRRLGLPHLARHAGRRPALALFTVVNTCVSIGLIAAIAVVTGTVDWRSGGSGRWRRRSSGDRDELYRFELPTNEHVMQAMPAWIRRMARRRRDEDDIHPAA
jgi:hypothetical protein